MIKVTQANKLCLSVCYFSAEAHHSDISFYFQLDCCLVHQHRLFIEYTLEQRKLPLSLAIMLNRLTAVTVRKGSWPTPIEMPAEACNQATGQLWGPRGVHLQTASRYISTLSSSFLLIHSYFCSRTHRRWGGGGLFFFF